MARILEIMLRKPSKSLKNKEKTKNSKLSKKSTAPVKNKSKVKIGKKQTKNSKDKKLDLGPLYRDYFVPTTHRQNITQQAEASLRAELEKLEKRYSYEIHSVSRSTVNGVVMDNASFKQQFNLANVQAPEALVTYFGTEGFLGFQFLAILSQHWLIDKACTRPAEDAYRKGFETTINTGEKITPDIKEAIAQADIAYRLNYNLIQFSRFNRIYGIRIAYFKIKSNDPDFYEKPFNIDGVTPGSYQGIVQVDPYWITPELDAEAAGDPASIHFYEPTWWRISGKRYHRSHLIISRASELPDILKPTYIYAGISIPQKIYQRVYAAERSANEAPMLLMTKRTDVVQVDMSQAIANQGAFEERMAFSAFYRDNYGQRIIDLSETFNRHDTSLTDADAVIMTQYQIVAAIADVPVSKLMGITLKGFNSSGNYEEASYHETLQSIQNSDGAPLIERHHQILIKSDIAPRFGIQPFSTRIIWKPLDTVTAEEKARVNKLKADSLKLLVEAEALNGQDVRDVAIGDPDFGFDGLGAEAPEPVLQDDFFNEGDNPEVIPDDPETEEV